MERQTIIDLRGSDSSPGGVGFGVLADPTGRRGRSLRRIGRAIAVLFAAWLAGLVLAGLGLLPELGIPLASRGGTDGGPTPLDARSPLVPAKSARPALAPPAAIPAARVAERPAPRSEGSLGSPRRAVARVRRIGRAPERTAATAPVVATPAPRPPAIPPGQAVAPTRRPATPPGETHRATTPRAQPTPHAKPAPSPTPSVTPSHGNSGSAPGRLSR